MAISHKISQRGAVSVYGLGQRFPVTLYPESWIMLAGYLPGLLKFIDQNKPAIEAQAKEFAKAEVIADARGLTGKEREDFFTKVFGDLKPVKADTPLSAEVAALEAKLKARGI